jgi:hypothetical protein
MNAIKKCEICGHYGKVGFTDCGLICESCFQKELLASAFNGGLKAAIEIIEKEVNGKMIIDDLATAIRAKRKEEHKKTEEGNENGKMAKI